MTPFLKQVADLYLDKEADILADCCFVFPNKRSATFFKHYLISEARRRCIQAFIEPVVTTIDKLVRRLAADLVEATRYQQLFTLYNCYRRCPGINELDFDRFRFWGDMLIADFNDAERYLDNPHDLFKNVSRLKEIGSNYLTQEQCELIKIYWGEDRSENDVENFWKHTSGNTNEEEKEGFNSKFLKLWEILDPLYTSFTESLQAQGLATSGRLYRLAANRLKEHGSDLLNLDRYVFVGFNVLTPAEIDIFERIKTLGRADFYWDFNSPMFTDLENRATRMIRANVKTFPSIHVLPEPRSETFGEIEILGIPSKVGQAKYAGTILRKWVKDKEIKDTANAINTAVVLPDESLLVPLIHAIPEDITGVNVTMGLPMRQTSLASLIKRIVSLHLRAQKSANDFKYFYEDVTAIASHPLLQELDPDGCKKLNDEIRARRLFMIPSNDIIAAIPALQPIFESVSDTKDFNLVYNYITNVLDLLERCSIASESRRIHNVIQAYRAAVEELKTAIETYHVVMNESSVFQLLESAINSSTVTFSGEPLQGLQVMGVLETRALDFDNVIITSMNERIFPRRHYAGSFIPETLRRGYGMATSDFREATFAYYFFRLLSRASRVALLYDSRTVGLKSSEKSRYLTQLLYLAKCRSISHKSVAFKGTTFNTPILSVNKTPRIMELIEQFKPGGDKRLSPSAINQYINCPLGFYLSAVEGLRVEDEITDYMDYSTFGSIVHQVLENLFNSLKRDPADLNENAVITKEIFQSFIDNEIKLHKYITRSVNDLYNRATANVLKKAKKRYVSELSDQQKQQLEELLNRPLEGDAYALGKIILYYVNKTLEFEKANAPITFVAAELKTNMVLDLGEGLKVNYTQVIDRIDRHKGKLRIIDYKTGGDVTEFSGIEHLFTPSSSRPKAILQLFLYCNVYAMLTGSNEPIQPLIYKFKSLGSSGFTPIIIKDGRTVIGQLVDYHSMNEDFMKMLHDKVAEIFDPEVPFTQAEGDHACKFCKFKPLCGRNG